MKTLVQNCLALSIFALNQKGIFRSSHSGTLTWDSGANIAYKVNLDRFNTDGEELVIAFFINYCAEYSRDQTKDINSMFPLVTTPCNFGKHRYWFICPGLGEKFSCLKRVAILHKPPSGERFACRKCWSLAYASQNLGGYQKKIGLPLSEVELEEMEASITKKVYKGLPTKRYSRYLRKYQQFSDFQNPWYLHFMKKNKKWIK